MPFLTKDVPQIATFLSQTEAPYQTLINVPLFMVQFVTRSARLCSQRARVRISPPPQTTLLAQESWERGRRRSPRECAADGGICPVSFTAMGKLNSHRACPERRSGRRFPLQPSGRLPQTTAGFLIYPAKDGYQLELTRWRVIRI